MNFWTRLVAAVALGLALAAAVARCGRDIPLGVDPANADAATAGDAHTDGVSSDQ
jgi:hypothetical protein